MDAFALCPRAHVTKLDKISLSNEPAESPNMNYFFYIITLIM